MNVIDVLTAPWAIMPSKLLTIQEVYETHSKREKIDIASIEAKLGRQLDNAHQDGYINNGGVAVIKIDGVIGKKFNMMSQISGGASTQMIERDIKDALSDDQIDSILLHIDSPGGTVDGTQTLANFVKIAGDKKPVVAFADGVMASAAYWIGSSANEIVASEGTTQIGSIGVVTTHKDLSKANEQSGVKVTEISAGKYKRMASQYAPLSKDGKALLQDQVDQLYTIFVDAVAENRGTDTETVLEDMADGRVFLAEDAMNRGMIDHIATFETTILNMQTGVWPMAIKKAEAQPDQPAADVKQEVITMDINAIKEQYPNIVAELQADGAKAERERIASCEAVSMPGFESIVNSMKLDGKSTGADVAIAIIGEQKKQQASHAKAFIDNAPAPVAHAAVDPVKADSTIDDKNLPIEDRAKAKWDSTPEIRHEYASFKGFLAVMKKEESGKLRISGTQH